MVNNNYLNSEPREDEEVVDLYHFGYWKKHPPRGRRYAAFINHDKFTFYHDKALGKEILEKAGYTPGECYSLYQKFFGFDFEKIGLNEEVDLCRPGIESFAVKESEVFHYTVDGEPETTEYKSLSPNQILKFAGITPVEDYYLVQIKDDQTQISFKDKPEEPIKMKCPGLKFISIYKSSTPVAYAWKR